MAARDHALGRRLGGTGSRARRWRPVFGRRTDSRDYLATLWFLLAAAVVGRLVLAFTSDGHEFDLNAYLFVQRVLVADPLQVYERGYSDLGPGLIYIYPPGFFPVIRLAGTVSHHTGLEFASVIRVPAILCDAAIAWVVQDLLGRRGHSELRRLLAAALVLLGPSFVAISAYHGQIDAVAILPAVVAVALWSRTEAEWRPYAAGALIGVGGAVKLVPLVFVLALLPTARSLREAIKLVVVAGAIPLLAMAPYLLEGDRARRVFSYQGGPGLGGLSLLADPALPGGAFALTGARPHGLALELHQHTRWITGGALAALAVFMYRYRPEPVQAAVLVVLTVWVFGVAFYLQYLVWGLPFILMAGYLRWALVLQAVALPATIVTYSRGAEPWQVSAYYTAPMILLWVAWTVALVVLLLRIRGETALSPGRTRPEPVTH
jgi:glycosyl transferase family 87